MEIAVHRDVTRFAQVAGPLYERDPLRHTVALTVLDALLHAGGPAAAMLTVHEVGRDPDEPDGCVGALLRSPGRPALVSAVPPHTAVAVEAALGATRPARISTPQTPVGAEPFLEPRTNATGADGRADGVAGPVPEVEAFAAAYRARTGGTTTVDMRLRLFALDGLVMPVGVPGRARVAGVGDAETLVAWREAFERQANAGRERPADTAELVSQSLDRGDGELIWELDGTPVAQASARRPVAGMSRIGPVYTPPEHRRHGYAAAATAAATRWALDAGADRVVLFTDLANPTANALYPRLGFRPVYDTVEVRFA